MANGIEDIEDPLLASWLEQAEQARSKLRKPTTLDQATEIGLRLKSVRIHYRDRCSSNPRFERALIREEHLKSAEAIDPRGNPEVEEIKAVILRRVKERFSEGPETTIVAC